MGEGDFVDSVGLDTEAIAPYIQEQESEDRRQDELELAWGPEERSNKQ
jgi:hypothetical protein